MKKTLLLVTLLLATSSLGWAGACASAPLTTYLAAGFSCTETIAGDTLTFSLFRYPTGTLPLQVTVVGNGFVFSPASGAPWSVSSFGAPVDVTIEYQVSGDLDAVTLNLESFSRTNAGAILGTENVGTGSGFLGGLTLYDNNVKGTNCQSGTQCFATLSLPEVAGPFSIQKDLVLSADGVNSSASVGALSNNFNTIPEPGSMLLFGSGLVALGGYIRRRQRK